MKFTTQHSSFTIITKFIGEATVKIYHGEPYGWICAFSIFFQQLFRMKEMCNFFDLDASVDGTLQSESVTCFEDLWLTLMNTLAAQRAEYMDKQFVKK